jgi:V8-like Glu-specific endopeptidase
MQGLVPTTTMDLPEFAGGVFGLPFTTSQVQPVAAQVTFPFATVGKLAFSDPGVRDHVCSAAVVRTNIVVTAGHCVAHASTDPSKRYFYTNWVFFPAYNNGNMPRGQWKVTFVGTTSEWFNGDGTQPNSQDVGMLEMQEIKILGVPSRIGEVVGSLGYHVQSLSGNSVTMLGYPANLDNGMVMERNDAGAAQGGGNNTVMYGSAMGQGSSGGPWVENFGIGPALTTDGGGDLNNPNWGLGSNLLVGVTSYAPVGLLGHQGASIFNDSFLKLLNVMCAHAAGNC